MSASWVQSLHSGCSTSWGEHPEQPHAVGLGGMLSKVQCSSLQGNLPGIHGVETSLENQHLFTWPTLSSWTEKFSASLVEDLFSLWKRNHEMWAVRFSKSHSGSSARMKEQTILSASCIIFSVSSCTAVERSRLAVAVSWWASCLHLCAVPAQTDACASPVRLLVKLLVQDAKDPIP